MGYGVLSHSQDLPPGDSPEAARPRDREEAERLHAAQGGGVGSFPRTGLGHSERLELEAPEQDVGEGAELLPGAVGPVVVGRDDVQRELALQFGEGLLLGRITMPNVPFKFSDVDVTPRRPAPLLGEHSREILRMLLGYAPAQVAELEWDGVLYAEEAVSRMARERSAPKG